MDKQRIIELAQELASVPDSDTGYTKHYILEDIENEINEKSEDKNIRILKGYSKAEQRELEEAKDNGFLSVIALFCSIERDDSNCHALYEKYYREDTNGNNQMARDIIDFCCGNAKFPEEKYVVHDKATDQYIYCNILAKDELHWWELGVETAEKKTKDEWLAINPAYELMLESVEDNEKI